MVFALPDNDITSRFLLSEIAKVNLLELSNWPALTTKTILKTKDKLTKKMRNIKKMIAIFVLLRADSFCFVIGLEVFLLFFD